MLGVAGVTAIDCNVGAGGGLFPPPEVPLPPQPKNEPTNRSNASCDSFLIRRYSGATRKTTTYMDHIGLVTPVKYWKTKFYCHDVATHGSSTRNFNTYFLACSLKRTGPIALCYYSGMPGKNFYTPSCTFSQDKNAAECDCYEIDENSPGADTNPYSFVLMTGILNKQVYENTVAACRPDGSLCLNLSDTNSGLMEAPVCDALRDKTLFSGADLFSDFSQIPIPQIAAAGYPPRLRLRIPVRPTRLPAFRSPSAPAADGGGVTDLD